jgi:hypothetical protein
MMNNIVPVKRRFVDLSVPLENGVFNPGLNLISGIFPTDTWLPAKTSKSN